VKQELQVGFSHFDSDGDGDFDVGPEAFSNNPVLRAAS